MSLVLVVRIVHVARISIPDAIRGVHLIYNCEAIGSSESHTGQESAQAIHNKRLAWEQGIDVADGVWIRCVIRQAVEYRTKIKGVKVPGVLEVGEIGLVLSSLSGIALADNIAKGAKVLSRGVQGSDGKCCCEQRWQQVS